MLLMYGAGYFAYGMFAKDMTRHLLAEILASNMKLAQRYDDSGDVRIEMPEAAPVQAAAQPSVPAVNISNIIPTTEVKPEIPKNATAAQIMAVVKERQRREAEGPSLPNSDWSKSIESVKNGVVNWINKM